MISRRPPILVGLAIIATMLTGCSGGTTSGNPTTTPASPSDSASSTAASDGAPPVQNPLPAKVLDGSPCDTALTSAEVKEFLGNTDPAKQDEGPTGKMCTWHNVTANGSINVNYQTKLDGGLRPAYRNIKPKATRWVELQPVQGYPAVGYLANGSAGAEPYECTIIVGVTDNLSYGVGIFIGANAQKNGVDPCTAGRDVADRVMTNIKARA